MPRHDQSSRDAHAWLERAESSLLLAKSVSSPGVRWEDYCYLRQQAAEKALKALHVHNGVVFRFTHNIDELATSLSKHGVHSPRFRVSIEDLTRYATETRYPGAYEPLTEEDYREAMEAAELVVNWVRSQIERAHG